MRIAPVGIFSGFDSHTVHSRIIPIPLMFR